MHKNERCKWVECFKTDQIMDKLSTGTGKLSFTSPCFLALDLSGNFNSVLCFCQEVIFSQFLKVCCSRNCLIVQTRMWHMQYLSRYLTGSPLFFLMTDFSFLVFPLNLHLCRCIGSSIEDCIGLMDRYLVCLLPMFFLQGSMREHWCMCVHATVDGE